MAEVSHTVLVVTSDSADSLQWSRIRRDVAERDGIVSLIVLDAARSRVVLSPAPARTSPTDVTWISAAATPEADAWRKVVDLVVEAGLFIPSIRSTEVLVFGSRADADALVLLFQGTERVRVRLGSDRARSSVASVLGGRQDHGLLRLVKVAAHTITIVDVPRAGGRGEERAPWNEQEDAWPADLTWGEGGEMRILVGPYTLIATPACDDLFIFRGTEVGPYGSSEFDVFGVTTDPRDLAVSTVSEYLRLDDPRYEFIPDSAVKVRGPGGTWRQVAQGWASLGTLPSRAGFDTTVDQEMEFRGVRGGRNQKIFMRTFPTALRPQVQVRTNSDHLYIQRDRACFGGGNSRWFQLLPSPRD